MKLLKESEREHPKVSLILLDWSVRESFHLLHYLSKQDVERDLFEVVVIEFYSQVSDAIQKFEDQVDTWMLLEMPEQCYYHKHLMYNCGIVLSKGDICVVCDSDAMVKEGFIRTITEEFDKDPRVVLHLDQFRNMRRDFYPFNYPSFEDVLGKGCINNVNGKTKGVVDLEDPIHTRNYGACMCARREDLIAIGGADEHIDFVGHICGPYDMTFRLMNDGLREIWHQSEFIYHTWHPGQAGIENYLGPHDGRHVSTTALEALTSGRIMPLLENQAIRHLRDGTAQPGSDATEKLIRPQSFEWWDRDHMRSATSHRQFADATAHVQNYKGFSIHNELGFYYAHLLVETDRSRQSSHAYRIYFEGPSLEDVRAQIDRATPGLLNVVLTGSRMFILLWQITSYAWSKVLKPLLHRCIAQAKAVGAALGGAYKRLRWRFEQFVRERAQIAESLSDIIPNLYHFSRARPDLATGATPVLLVDSKRFVIYLRLLACLRIVPPVRIVRVASIRELETFLEQYRTHEPKPPLVVARGTYVKFYSVMNTSEYADKVAII